MNLLDIKNIFVVVAPDYTEDEVRNILIDDGYVDNFVFGSRYTIDDRDVWKDIMGKCDEVWIFGKSYRTFGEAKWQHSWAKKEGHEIWAMG